MNSIYQRFILALIVLFAGWLVFQFPGPTLRIGETVLRVEVADTKELREQGLSGREVLKEGEGILFVFEEPGVHGFWMRDMNFPLDIIWIGQDRKVVEIMKNIAPETFPEVFYPAEPVEYVLETNAGWVERNNIQPGDMLTGP